MSDEVHMALKMAAVKYRLSKGEAVVRMLEDWLMKNGFLPAEVEGGERR
jgi:hypothetical protein